MLRFTQKSRRLLFIAIAVLATLLVICGIVWVVAKNRGTPPRGPAVAVGVSTVRQGDAPLQLNALGTVNSTYTAVVRSRVDGQLMKIHFREGQLVREGQLLAELDARPYKAALLQAEGQLMRDSALLQNAKIDLQRYKQLLEQNSIARQQVDTQAALVKQYEGTVRLDQGAVDNAKLQLAYSRITAPISGRVGLRQVDPGNIVHATDTNGIVTITQDEPINVVFAVPEIDLTQVLKARATNPNLTVEAWDRDNKNKLSEGTILAIDNQLSTETGTISLKSKFDNKNHELFPNQFVNVRLHLGSQANAITIPTVAVQLGKPGHYVYRVNQDETVSLTKVKIGATSGENTIVEDGLEPGQVVVIDGLDKLRDKSKIRIVDRSAEAAAIETDKKAARQKQETPAKTGENGEAGKTAAPAASTGEAGNGTGASRQ